MKSHLHVLVCDGRVAVMVMGVCAYALLAGLSCASPVEQPNSQSPGLICKPLPAMDIADWNSIQKAFEKAQVIPLLPCRPTRDDPKFMEGSVRTAWTPKAFWVYAVLKDADIFNKAKELNDEVYRKGDSFEVFLKAVDEDSYLELEVGPDNQKLQLLWPRPYAYAAAKNLDDVCIREPFRTFTQVSKDQQEWRVLIEIPAEIVKKAEEISEKTDWLFSFGRYDYTTGARAFVLSSSTIYKKLDFHRIEDWGRIRFLRE